MRRGSSGDPAGPDPLCMHRIRHTRQAASSSGPRPPTAAHCVWSDLSHAHHSSKPPMCGCGCDGGFDGRARVFCACACRRAHARGVPGGAWGELGGAARRGRAVRAAGGHALPAGARRAVHGARAAAQAGGAQRTAQAHIQAASQAAIYNAPTLPKLCGEAWGPWAEPQSLLCSSWFT